MRITVTLCSYLRQKNPPAPTWGPSHRTQFSMNLSSASLSHRKQLSRTGATWIPLPQGAVLQRQAAPLWVLHRVTGPSRTMGLEILHSRGCNCICAKCFFFFLKYVTPEVLPQSLMVLALSGSRATLELADIGSTGHGESF